MIIREAAGRKIPHSRVFKDEITKTIEDNNSKLQLTDKQKERWHKKCLCLIEFKNIEEIEPLDFDKQSNIEDVVVGTSIPYNYEKSKF